VENNEGKRKEEEDTYMCDVYVIWRIITEGRKERREKKKIKMNHTLICDSRFKLK
jgi:hypothetical protein